MKKLLLLLSVVLLAASCAKENNTWNSVPVQFSSFAIGTRTVFSASGSAVSVAWAQDDTIGVWCSNSNRGNYPYTADVVRTDATKAQFVGVSEDKMFLYDGKACTYYAYYPYNPANGDSPLMAISLPSTQVQAAAGDAAHLSAQPFKAEPVSVSGENSQVDFSFTPAVSTVHLALKMNDGTTIPVPVRKLRILAADGLLASAKASLDLAAANAAPAATEGEPEVTLTFSTMPSLVPEAKADAYLSVLPGAHAQQLSAEITAIDGSVATVALPAVSFLPGKCYSRELSLALDDFVQAVPFDITPAGSLTVNAGEAISFNIQGAAESIGFYSGEKYHSYEYSDKDRIEHGNVYMSLRQALLSGGQGDCLDIKLSTDYDGTLTETAILGATWIDMTDDFNLDTSISGSGNPNSGSNYSKFKKSADVTVSEYAGGNPFRIVLFWQALPDMGGRTVSWITGIKVWNDKEVLMNQENSKGTNPYLIEGASYGNDSSHCGWYDITANGAETTNCFRFFSTFTLTGTAQRHAYAVIDDEFQAESVNKGHDTPFSVQSGTEETPASYSYTFAEPGTYTVVFVASCPTLSGPKTETRSFNITVL